MKEWLRKIGNHPLNPWESLLLIGFRVLLTPMLFLAVLALSTAFVRAPGAVRVQTTASLSFAPASVTIHAGDSVTWQNVSNLAHTVTADPALADSPRDVHLPPKATPFDSGSIDRGETYSHTFTVPGRYRYFCRMHERDGMIGEVIVQK